MKAVDQEFFYDKGEVGDCVRAVTASILELDPKDVPHFVKLNPGSDWYEDWEQFMIDHGKTPTICWMLCEDGVPPIPRGYYLASGPAERGCKHIVIMHEGKLAHDPHPSRAGLVSIEAIWSLS
jgi:hypothetical protein